MDISFSITLIGILKFIIGLASVFGVAGLGFLFALSFLKSPFGGSVQDPDWGTRVFLLVPLTVLVLIIFWAF